MSKTNQTPKYKSHVWLKEQENTGKNMGKTKGEQFIISDNQNLPVIRELFKEYTNLLVGRNAQFAQYLEMQNYDKEEENPYKKYAPPENALLIAWHEGKPAGCIALKKMDGGTAELKRLFVKEEYRQMGLARQLVEAILAAAKQAGYKKLRLDTLPELTEAIALYKKLGFKTIKPYNDNPIDGSVFFETEV